MACINIKNPEYIALYNSLSKYGLTNQGIIQAYIHEYQEETNSDNYPDISYFSNEFITVQGDIATEEPSLFIYKGDNLVGHVRLENTGDQLIEREVNVYTPGRGIGSFAYSKIAEMAQAQGFQFRSDDRHSEAGTNLWEGLVRQDKAEKLNNVYYYKQQENKQKNQEQLSVIEPSNSIKEGVDFIFEQNPELQRIGNKQLYSQYLDTIFPDSKVKDIVYHYNSLNNKFNKFDKSFIGTQSLRSQDNEQGFSFVDNRLVARAYGSFNTEIYSLPQEVWSTLDENIYKQYDKNIISALINPQKGDWKNQQNGWNEIMIKNPDQIHILGSEQDIKGFKNYVNNTQVKQSDITTNFEQYFPDYAYLNQDERQIFIKGIESGDITITCTRGTIKAESGMVFGNKLGSKWELVKDLKGYKSHEYGGVDLEVGKGSINIKRGKSSIEARHGLLIYK